MKKFIITYRRENSETVTTIPTLEKDFYGAMKTARLLVEYLKNTHHINAELLGVCIDLNDNESDSL